MGSQEIVPNLGLCLSLAVYSHKIQSHSIVIETLCFIFILNLHNTGDKFEPLCMILKTKILAT